MTTQDRLATEHQDLVSRIATKHYRVHPDFQEVLSAANDAFGYAIRKWDPTRSASFRQFAGMVIILRLRALAQKRRRGRSIDAVSLTVEEGVEEQVQDLNAPNPAEEAGSNERVAIVKEVLASFTGVEIIIARMAFMEDATLAHISRVTSITSTQLKKIIPRLKVELKDRLTKAAISQLD